MKKPGLPKKLFSLLDRLGGLGPEDLLKEFTEETVREVRILAEELDEKLVLERVLSEKRFIEVVGHYNAQTDPSTIKVDEEKVKGWLARGAQPTDQVKKLLRTQGIDPSVR